MEKIGKNENGSITLFVLIAMIFLFTIACTIYISAMAKLQAQKQDLKRIKANYEKNLTEEELTNLYEKAVSYTVTFDANGGNVEYESKKVKYGENYGKLPIPTKEGYTFIGWNGKNMFNYATNKYWTLGTIKDTIDGSDGYIRNINYGQSNIWPIFYEEADKKYIKFENNKIYTLSFDIWSDIETLFNNRTFFVNNSTITTHNLSNITTKKQRLKATITYIENTNHSGGGGLIHIYPTTSFDNNFYISNILVEEGTTATEYEPYYITMDTKVVQKRNHTLTAVWKEK